MYIHLIGHNTFSLHEGLLTSTDPVRAAQTDVVQTLGLTNHNLLTGAIEFAMACKAADIQAIIGTGTNLNDVPVNLLATVLEGGPALAVIRHTFQDTSL